MIFPDEINFRKGLDLLYMSGFLSYLYLTFSRHHSSSLGCFLLNFILAIVSTVLVLYLIQDLSVQCWVTNHTLNNCPFSDDAYHRFISLNEYVYACTVSQVSFKYKKICNYFLWSSFMQSLQWKEQGKITLIYIGLLYFNLCRIVLISLYFSCYMPKKCTCQCPWKVSSKHM